MKTKTVILGTVMVITSLMLVPSISAVEYNTTLHSYENQIKQEIKNYDFDSFIQNLQGIDNPRIQHFFSTIETTKLKQLLTSEFFIDYAILLILFNILIVRLISKLTAGPPPNPVQSMVMFTLGLLFYVIIFVAEYQSGEILLPRDLAYQTYFQTLMLIFANIGFQFIPENKPLLMIIIPLLTGLLIGKLSIILGDLLYQMLGEPS